MPVLRDLKGQVFGELAVLRRVQNDGSYVCWEAQCSCGKIVVKQARHITLAPHASCGCDTRDKQSASSTYATHRMSKSKTYKSWSMMKSRCTNQKYTHYEYYGGRGVTVCQSWLDSFEAFLADMGERPEGTTLERIDANKNYTPDNCRWATRAEQANTRRNVKKYYHGGKFKTLREISSEVGIARQVIYLRLRRGWSLKKSVTF